MSLIISSKNVDQDIMDDFRCREVLYIPGVMTPTEVKAFLMLELLVISKA